MKKTIAIILCLIMVFSAVTIAFADGDTQVKKLQLSKTDKKVLGVCGGIGEYFNIDSNTVRIGFVVFSALGGSGVLVYFIMYLIM